MSRFEGVFKRILEGQQKLRQYWKKSPTAKIVLLNTGIYVLLDVTQCMWKFKVVP